LAALRRPDVKTLWQVAWNLLLITVGSTVCAMAVNGILIPHQFFSGGFTGIALLLHYLFPSLSVSGVYFVLNIPVFALGWMYVGRRFFVYSIVGLLVFSAVLQWSVVRFPVQDQMLSALLAGIVLGVGSGIVLRSVGSAGGTDILSVILMKRFSIRLGTTILVFNGLILVAAAVLSSLEGALYTLIYFFVNARIVNLVVTGLSQRKAVFIISSEWESISHAILEKVHRGVTVIRGTGGYTGREHKILYTVITFRELSQIKQVIRDVDPKAFVVFTDTLEVMGQGVGNQPHW